METKTNNGRHVADSSIFSSFLKKAENYMKTPGRVTNLVNDAYQKASQQNDVSEIASSVWDSLQDLFRMIKAVINGEYTGIPNKTIVGGVAVLIYFISPIDLVPDFIPIVGLLDDMSLMAWFMTSIKDELEKFRSWENTGGSIGSTAMGLQAGNSGRTGSPVKDHGAQGGLATPGAPTQGQSASAATSSTSSKTSSKAGKSGSSSGSGQSADFPGSAGEMRKDVTGEAKDETHRVGNTGGSKSPKTTGNLGADESRGSGQNLGDSSRTVKSDNNPNKDGAHNR